MSPKLLCVLNWVTDSRIKPINIGDDFKIDTPYGTIFAKQAPAENYISSSIYSTKVLYIDLNEAETKRIVDQVEMKSLKITRIRFLFGYKGFLSIEVECDFLCDSFKGCAAEVAAQAEKDQENLADFIAKKESLSFYDKVISCADDYLISNKQFWFGTHKFIENLIQDDCNEWNDNFIYNSHVYVDSEEEAKSFIEECHMDSKKNFIEGCYLWLDFATYLWYMPNSFDADKMEHLAFSSIPITWQNLIFDVGTINYKNILQLLSDGKKIPTKIIRQIVNRDNTYIMEIGLMLRGQTIEQNEISMANQSEGMHDFRRVLFENGQKNLLDAANGFDTISQSSSSKMMETILTILTAMSVYSVTCDACSLLLMETEQMTFHFVSSSLFVVATIVMLVIFLLTKKGISNR
jgi:hypothetical protein